MTPPNGWEFEAAASTERRETLRVRVVRAGRDVPYSEVIGRWQRDEDFCGRFVACLSDAPFAAYYWETPPLTAATAGRPFEFVLASSPELAASAADPSAFSEHLAHADRGGIVVFDNLGGDATLVVPVPASAAGYPHLASFARGAPRAQQVALWRAVGAAVERRLSERPVWVSTSGLGVPWLHVRLDDRPKYYVFGPYRDPAYGGS